MDNPENNQHFNVAPSHLGGEGGLRISTLCTIEKMLTIANDPLGHCGNTGGVKV